MAAIPLPVAPDARDLRGTRDVGWVGSLTFFTSDRARTGKRGDRLINRHFIDMQGLERLVYRLLTLQRNPRTQRTIPSDFGVTIAEIIASTKVRRDATRAFVTTGIPDQTASRKRLSQLVPRAQLDEPNSTHAARRA